MFDTEVKEQSIAGSVTDALQTLTITVFGSIIASEAKITSEFVNNIVDVTLIV